MKLMSPSLLLTTILSASAIADDAPRHTMPGVMATRAVSNYLGLERTLAAALTTADQATLRSMLDDEFVYRDIDSRDAIGADAWVATALATPWLQARVGRMTVQEYGDVDVVAFVLDGHRKVHKGSRHKVAYVVDVWQTSTRKLLSRHNMPSGTHAGLPDGPDTRE